MKKRIDDQSVNPLCGRCVRRCRQPYGTVLVDCPRFLSRPFKITEHRFDQLDLFSEKKKPKDAENADKTRSQRKPNL